MSNPLTVVISQTNSKNPLKRELEEAIASQLSESAARVMVIHNLYDLKPKGETFAALQAIEGDFVVCAWMFERAAHWTLDRNAVRGQVGEIQLRRDEEDDDELDDEVVDEEPDEKIRVASEREAPDRRIYCLDLRVSDDAQSFVAEIQRIAALGSTAPGEAPLDQWLKGSPTADQLERFQNPANDTAIQLPAANGNGNGNGSTADFSGLQMIEENTGRRWYPVIDFSRCTNCMECIDFCLFGVYGVDSIDTILVEQPDNCRKGCPACSRVCPENAIIFPQHKTPTIAGAPAQEGGLKIDLSLLFGAPDAAQVAAQERDEQLVLAGRAPVGDDDLKPRQTENTKPKDDLDNLIDGLDDLDF